jgi:hypothetical protein
MRLSGDGGYRSSDAPQAPAAPAGRPGADGSLAVDGPSDLSRFDMGNEKVFATFDGRGSLRRGSLVEGYDLGAWRTELLIDGEAAGFDRGRAIGRLWELRSAIGEVEVELDSFLDRGSPSIRQRLSLRNGSSTAIAATIRLDITAIPEVPFMARLRDWEARLVALLPRTAGWWARSGAKAIRPYVAHRLSLLPDGRILARGKKSLIWRASSAPSAARRRGGTVAVEFESRLGPSERLELHWSISEGDSGLGALDISEGRAAIESARDYGRWLAGRYSGGDALERSMFVAGLNAAVSMFKEFPEGFAGLVAGPDYGYPPRLYFRDGYWTAQILLAFRPELVRRHILSLARGVHEDGRCPSGVFAPHVLRDHAGSSVDSLDWLPDHIDSPCLFILLVAEYVEATGDRGLLDEPVSLWAGKGREPRRAALWSLVSAAADHLSGDDRDGLIEKPHAANDWADNVKRSCWVTYDQSLYAAALAAAAGMAALRGEVSAADSLGRRSRRARAALNERLWDGASGHFVDYGRPGFAERHFAIDSLVALRYGLVDEERIESLLDASLRLIARDNDGQPYGDWGVMCAFPAYGLASDLFGKSSSPLNYHNGADWPYWDGVFAEALRDRGRPEWCHVLIRWWEYGLSRGWLTPVEYYSPAFEPGGMLQGWSSMPAAVLAEARSPRPRPWAR